MRRLLRSIYVPLAILGVLALATLLAPVIAPFDPAAQSDPIANALQPPSAAHWFGTDTYARDVFSRVLYGGRASLSIAAIAVLVALTVGIAVGALAALGGRVVDTVLMRITDAALAIPRLLLLLLLVATAGAVDPMTLAVVLGATGWMSTARLVRQETRRLLATEYVRTAADIGVRGGRLWRVHILPALAPTLAVAATISFAVAVPLEAALSFLGLGVRPPHASWGNIILETEGRLLRAWWLLVFPTLSILLTTLSANLLAERLGARTEARKP